MKVIIAGSRDILDMALVEEAIANSGFKITEVVCGLARGVDILGKEWATKNNIKCQEFPARWQQYGRSAGYHRNLEMGKYADAAIIIWDGKSPGTKMMIDIMKQLNKPFYIMITRKDANGKLYTSWG